jgi:hypothetical protein
MIQLLTWEMENMIIETNIKKEAGPLESVSEAAIAAGCAREDDENGDGDGDGDSLSSPRDTILAIPLGHESLALPSPQSSPPAP